MKQLSTKSCPRPVVRLASLALELDILRLFPLGDNLTLAKILGLLHACACLVFLLVSRVCLDFFVLLWLGYCELCDSVVPNL